MKNLPRLLIELKKEGRTRKEVRAKLKEACEIATEQVSDFPTKEKIESAKYILREALELKDKFNQSNPYLGKVYGGRCRNLLRDLENSSIEYYQKVENVSRAQQNL